MVLFLLKLLVDVLLCDAMQHSSFFRCVLATFIHVQKLLQMQSELFPLLDVSLCEDIPHIAGVKVELILCFHSRR